MFVLIKLKILYGNVLTYYKHVFIFKIKFKLYANFANNTRKMLLSEVLYYNGPTITVVDF